VTTCWSSPHTPHTSWHTWNTYICQCLTCQIFKVRPSEKTFLNTKKHNKIWSKIPGNTLSDPPRHLNFCLRNFSLQRPCEATWLYRAPLRVPCSCSYTVTTRHRRIKLIEGTLPIRDCTRSCNNRDPWRLKLSAIDVTPKTFFERLYLVLGFRKFVPWVICPYAPTTTTVHPTSIPRLPCNCAWMAPQFFLSERFNK